VTILSVVIPTYRREQVLLNTLEYLLCLDPAPSEILVVDQTPEHEPLTTHELSRLESGGRIRWIRLPHPSITHAMNTGLEQARGEVALFLDDDIIPHPNIIAAHLCAHKAGYNIVAGQVLQPGEEPVPGSTELEIFRFSSSRKQLITELMGGNFSIKRRLALDLGGFDENFVQVAYRFEAEFAKRALTAGEQIFFEPEASIRHLKSERGGTRSYGHHLTTARPSHAVGAYYYLLRTNNLPRRAVNILYRPFRAVKTKHHLTHPWWIPLTLIAEITGMAWAAFLYLRGPRLINRAHRLPLNND
jgi:GT2 family glycosyltransferase